MLRYLLLVNHAATGRRWNGLRAGMRAVHVVFDVELDRGPIGILRVLHGRRNATPLWWQEGMAAE